MNGAGEVLLRRRRLVAPALLAAESRTPPPVGKLPRRLGMVNADVPSGVAALEFELLQLGFLVSGELYRALAGLDVAGLTRVGRLLLHGLRKELGASDSHVPLFRKFPDSVPVDTEDFYVRRMFSLLLQTRVRPCVLCGQVETVHPVSPCAHLVCRACWDGSDFSACPICHRRISLGDPFLRPSERHASVDRDAVTTTALLRLSADPAADCRELATALLERRTPMAGHERAELELLLDTYWPQSLSWLPKPIPVKETRAAVVAYGLGRGASELLDRHADTATDVLRVLYALMGADPGLRTPPVRHRSLPRPVRRAVLGRLEAMPYLVEDLLRHRAQWQHMAETLHPHEHHARFPGTALAFAALRGTRPDAGTAFGRALLERAAEHQDVEVRDDGRLRAATFASRVESALARGAYDEVWQLLATRPGELLRRLSHLLRQAPDTAKPQLLREAAERVAPGVLLAALGQIRTAPGGTRLFLPRGGTARFWTAPDRRPAAPDGVVLEAGQVLTGELLRRAALLPPLRRALLDEGLADLVAPTSERTASAALVRLARGSVQPIPHHDRLRFFLHWAEPEDTRVDLDLSVAVFDGNWRFEMLCDYTRLRPGRGLTHSGDLTSAPEPLGASEFIDVDVRALRGRYLVPIVFSYNDVPYERLVRGYAGFMERPEGLFDPLAVRQRFDLAGPAKILVPLVADLWTRTMRWADLNLSAAGYGHNVAGNTDELAALGAALESAFGDRVTLWEVACWHAAARAAEVVVRRRDGGLVRYERRPGEDVAGFAARLTARADAPPLPGPPADVDLAVLVSGDVEVPESARVYALHPYDLGPARLMDAADLLSDLSPDRMPSRRSGRDLIET
ncbi:MXAN_6230/SCO0854 family RING domain-containing protein [Nonomuraea sp. NPDC050404]|uniref:MXAN_6230/SCO0854 family RING domain-containing protein n=1 Tax=Nonomuraea sp. NPDC050404 TaxID=3155783 RepID=UPI00340FA589